MKFLELTEDAFKMINGLSHMALTKLGLEAYPHVKALEAWLASHVESDEAPKPKESK